VTLSRPLISAVLALAAGLVALYWIIDRTVHATPPALAGFKWETPVPAPRVTFVDDRGGAHTLAEFRGRYLLLNLWATWCAPCARELPSLARLSAQMKDERFRVVAVALPPGSVADAHAFLAGHDAGALAAYGDANTMFFRAFHAYGLPLTVLIDPDGREVARVVGPAQWDAPEAVAYLKQATQDTDGLTP
jgi:thiol-disulfide isomerase/thioredoxin